jgi:hypothetical protein
MAFAREIIRQEFIKDKSYSSLFWLDDDIFLPKWGVQRLLSYNKEQVGFYVHVYFDPHKVPCILKSGDVVMGQGLQYFSFDEIDAYRSFIGKLQENKLSEDEKKLIPFIVKDQFHPQLFQPYAVNIGCLLVQRNVVEAIPFRTHDTFVMGEDLWYFNEANDKKFQFWCDSVTEDTPIIIRRYKKFIDIIPIKELYPKYSDMKGKYRKFKERACKYYHVPKEIEILTKEGNWSNIKYVFGHRVKKPVYKVTCGSATAKITGDHSLFRENKEVKVKDLNIGDFIDVIDLPHFNNNNLINEDLSWLYGFFAAEGHANYVKGRFSSFSISNKNLEYLNRCREIIERYYCLSTSISKPQHGVYSLNLHGDNQRLDLIKRFRNNFYNSLSEKKVPIEILNGSLKVKEAFLNGLWDGDGYSSRYKTTLSTNSMALAAGTEYLLKCLGKGCSSMVRKDKENITDLRILKGKRRWIQGNQIKDISKITYKSKMVYDLETVDESHSFVGGIGGICFHNSSYRCEHKNTEWESVVQKGPKGLKPGFWIAFGPNDADKVDFIDRRKVGNTG